MENGALFVALAILVIIITVMVWNRNVDSYSRIGGCQVKCQGLSETDRALCIQECLGHQIMRYGGQQCSSDDDCQADQVCVLGGFYTGDDDSVFPNPNIGTCMNQSDPGVVEWKRRSNFHRPPLPPHHRPDNEKDFGPCISNCLAMGKSASECQAICGHSEIPGKLKDVPQYLRSKGSSLLCAAQCLSVTGDPEVCRSKCGDLPSPPPDDHPTWSFTMSGEITPSSKVENYGFQSCPPGQFWDAYANKGQGGCQKIFSGRSSARAVNNKQPDEPTEVNIPGTTLPGYGVGKRDPRDEPSGVFISSDPGYGSRKKTRAS